jgi:2-polyprenyl-6-methoxyphenol hydroxylase-like FAD-dependent oxidoreductase
MSDNHETCTLPADSSSSVSSRSSVANLVIGIVGGGIAGLATAVALQARGFRCIVFERDASFNDRHQGYGLTMQQGGRALLRLGLADQVAKQACTSSRHCIFDSQGNLVFFWGTVWDELKESRGKETPEKQKELLVGQHNIHIPRQALRQVLLDALQPNTVRWNSRVLSVVQEEEQEEEYDDGKKQKQCHPLNHNDITTAAKRPCANRAVIPSTTAMPDGSTASSTPFATPSMPDTTGQEVPSPSNKNNTHSLLDDSIPCVVVHLAGNESEGNDDKIKTEAAAETETVSVSLLIACDGIRSSVRNQLVGDPLHYLDTLVVLGIFDCTASHFALFEERIVQMSDGETRLFMMPFSGHKHKAMWQLSFRVPHEQALLLSAGGPTMLKEEAIRRCGKWAEPIPSIFSATPFEFVTGYPIYDRDPLEPNWNTSDSLISLAGDSAHPLSPFKGQGANAGLCDALTLAECLNKQLRPEEYANKRLPWQKDKSVMKNKNKNKKKKSKKKVCVLDEFGTRAAVVTALREHERLMAQRMSSKVIGSRKAVETLHCGTDFSRPEYHAQRCNFPDSVAELVHCLRAEHALGTWTDPNVLDQVAFSSYSRVIDDGASPQDAVKRAE